MDANDFDAGQEIAGPDGRVYVISRFYATLPGQARCVCTLRGAPRRPEMSDEFDFSVDEIEAVSETGVGAAFGERVGSLDELSPGNLLYANSVTWEGEPNVLVVLALESQPDEERFCGFRWRFVDLADPGKPRLASDRDHFTWEHELERGGYRRADFLADLAEELQTI